MVLSASAKLCIFWYLVLLGFFGLCAWRKFRYQRRPLLLSPWLFLILVIAISSLLTSLMGLMLLPLAIEFAIGIIISFIHPIFAASFFLTTFIVKPWELLPENDLMLILPRCLAALAFASLFAHFARTRSKEIFFNSGVGLFMGFMAWILLSTLTAYNSSEAMTSFTTAMFPVIATFLLIINASSEKLDLEIIRGGLIVAVLALTSIAIVRTLWSWGFNFSIKIPRLEGEGQWANANDLAALMVLVLPLVSFPLISRSKSLWNKFFGLILVAFLLFGVWLSQSRGAMMAIVAGYIVYFSTKGKLRLKLIIPIATILLVCVVFLASIRRDESDTAGSNSMRLEYTIVGFRMLKTNPITGVGFDNYSNLFERYTTKFDEYGKRTAHSSWILAMAENGLPGLALILSLFIYVIRRAFSLRSIQPEQLVAMVSYGICMSLLSHTYQLAPYVLFAWVLSSKKLLVPASSEVVESKVQVLRLSL